MNKNIEKEFKILVNEDTFFNLYNIMGSPKFVNQVNVYYDTVNQDIEKLKGAMRIRTKNGEHCFTFKIYRNNYLEEYECKVAENSAHALNEPSIQALLKEFDIDSPYVKKATLETRRAMVVDDNAELCFDINLYNNITDYEIEYEFKKEHDGLSKFNQILQQVSIQYESNCKSKIVRALNK